MAVDRRQGNESFMPSVTECFRATRRPVCDHRDVFDPTRCRRCPGWATAFFVGVMLASATQAQTHTGAANTDAANIGAANTDAANAGAANAGAANAGAANIGAANMASLRMDLSGQWQVRFQGNRDDTVGARSDEGADGFHPVQLPGALRDSGLGEPVGPGTRWIATGRPDLLKRPEYAKYQEKASFKMPFWLQPERHFAGAAEYRRTVKIPESWLDKRVLLTLERPHWQTQVWVDGEFAGDDNSLSTPHVYDLTKRLTPGEHSLTIRVDNSLDLLDVGINSHSVSDHTQTAWNGIVGNLELRAEPAIRVENIQVFPSDDARSARIRLRCSSAISSEQHCQITLRIAGWASAWHTHD